MSAQDFLRYLFERHHLTTRSRAGGRAGLRDAIGMLQGFEIAAAAWERDVLAPRVAGYRAEWLDELCLAGEVAWARLSPRRSTAAVARVDLARDAHHARAAARPRLAARSRARRRQQPEPPTLGGVASRRSRRCAGAARSSSTTSPVGCASSAVR